MSEYYKKEQVLVGAAKVYVSSSDSTETSYTQPQIPTGTPGEPLSNGAGDGALDTDTNWRHVGWTSGGVEFNYQPDYGEVEVDQTLDSVKLFKQKQTATVTTNLAEATLENLLLAWGQPAATLTGDGEEDELGISSGELGDEPVERSLLFIGPSPRSATNKKRERVYLVRRAIQVESSAHTLNRAEATQVPVAFRLMPEVSYTNKAYGVVRDRTISA